MNRSELYRRLLIVLVDNYFQSNPGLDTVRITKEILESAANWDLNVSDEQEQSLVVLSINNKVIVGETIESPGTVVRRNDANI